MGMQHNCNYRDELGVGLAFARRQVGLLALLLAAASSCLASEPNVELIRTADDLKAALSNPSVASACLANDIQLSNEVPFHQESAYSVSYLSTTLQ
jgi:hypothetical protein